MIRLPLAALLCLLAAAASAESQRDAYDCSALQGCAPGQACTEGGTAFTLTFLGGGIEIGMGGETLSPAYDGTLRSAAWRHGETVYQMRFTGDGSGVLTVTPEAGDFTQARLEWLHCSPQ